MLGALIGGYFIIAVLSVFYFYFFDVDYTKAPSYWGLTFNSQGLKALFKGFLWPIYLYSVFIK